MVPESADEERDVAPERAPVGVDLVEHEEPASVVREDVLAVRRPNQEVLEHHVVREQDVRGVRRILSLSACLVPRSYFSTEMAP